MQIVIDIDDNLYTRLFDNGVDNYDDAEDMATAIRKGTPLPSAEPERKVGKWYLLDECANEGWYCDQCHKKVFKVDFSNTMRKYKFCPNCGAKMEVN